MPNSEHTHQLSGVASGDHRVPSWLDTLLSCQEAQWAASSRTSIESLLAQVAVPPEQREEALLELIFNEVVLREESGESPALLEYLLRFPHLAASLRVQWEIDRLLSGDLWSETGIESRARSESHFVPCGKTQRSADTGHPRLMGRYEIEAELGRGGIGVVHRAWDSHLKRVVALKRMRAGVDARADDLRRFRKEAEAIAQLHHPHIVQVYDIGEQHGLPYLAMEYCNGGSLAGYLQRSPMAPRDAAQLLLQLATAVAAAHAQGIVHRDLKPANVLLSVGESFPAAQESASYGGVPARPTSWPGRRRKKVNRRDAGSELRLPAEDGNFTAATLPGVLAASALPLPFPKISDFGLAKLGHCDSGATATGNILGTPAYMAPEQAFGDGKRAGPTADVYSLGAILYECLTGRAPFGGDSVAEVLQHVREEEPIYARRLESSIPLDLETITHKCLRKAPQQRYPTAAELAEDLARFIADRPILARRESWLESLSRIVRRYPWAAGLSLLSVALLLAVTVGSLLFARQLQLANTEAEKARETSEHQRDLAVYARSRARAALDTLTSDLASTFLRQQECVTVEQEQFLNNVLDYYREFSDVSDTNEASQELAATATHRAAQIHDRLGNKQEARSMYALSVARFQTLHSRFPHTPEYAIQLAKSLNGLGYAQRDFGEFQLAVRSFRQGIQVLRFMLQKKSDASMLMQLAWLQHNLAWVEYENLGNPAAGRRCLREAFRAYDAIDSDSPEFREQAFPRILADVSLAIMESASGDWEAGRDLFQSSRNKLQDLVARYPNNSEYAVRLGWCSSSYAMALGTHQDFPAAHESLQMAIDTLTSLGQRYPSDVRFQKQLGYSLRDSAELWQLEGRPHDAVQTALKAVQLVRRLAEQFPDSHEIAWDLGAVYQTLGAAYLSDSQQEQAIESFARCLELWRRLDGDATRSGRFAAFENYPLTLALVSGLTDLDSEENWKLAHEIVEHRFAGGELQSLRATMEARLLRERVHALLLRGHVDQAIAQLGATPEPPDATNEALVYFARANSLIAGVVDDEAVRTTFEQKAMELIRRATAAGQSIDTDAFASGDFAPLQSVPGFPNPGIRE